MKKELYIVKLTVLNVRTLETSDMYYYFLSKEKAQKRVNLLEKKCFNFETFADDWKYSMVYMCKTTINE